MVGSTIRARYVKNVYDFSRPSFVRDLFSVIPLDLIELSVPLRGALRANRLLRIPRIFSLLREAGEGSLGRHTVRRVETPIVVIYERRICCARMASFVRRRTVSRVNAPIAAMYKRRMCRRVRSVCLRWPSKPPIQPPPRQSSRWDFSSPARR